MTKIKFCGLFQPCDIEAVNEIQPEYIGFVFVANSKRYITFEKAKQFKQMLFPNIKVVGVFSDESIDVIAKLMNDNVIDIAQLHGNEDENYIRQLRKKTNKCLIKAFCIKSKQDVINAKKSSADYILLDAGKGSGKKFNWQLIEDINRPYFLAGGLDFSSVNDAIKKLHPFALDVSSGIENNGKKDKAKMAAFAHIVREEKK